MGTELKKRIDKIFGLNDQAKEKSEDLQNKVSKAYGTEEKTYNPFLNKNGELNNPYIDYQKVLDNPGVSSRAKEYITQATGLRSSQADTDSFEGYVGSSLEGNDKLGFVSAKYETGGYNGGLVSSGSGDYGGVSYGVPQFSTKTGSADSFVSWLKKTNPNMAKAFGNSKAGTEAFSSAWKQVYSQYGESFTKQQTQYAYDNFVKPLADKAYKKYGVDYTKSRALQELIFSTAIQFGGGDLGLAALGNVSAKMSDAEIINASYDKKIANYKNFFKSSSSSVQESVRNRFVKERNDVLSLVGKSSQKSKAAKGGSKNIVSAAKKYIGTPYVWGGESAAEGGMDCSGFVYAALKSAGYNVERTTAQGYRGYGKKVSKSNMQPGDLVFFGKNENASHVGIYIGNGQMIHSAGGSKNTKSNPGKGVTVANVNYRSDFIEARRY